MAVRSLFVLAEYGSDAGDRWVVDEVGVMELTAQEVAEMNCAMVRSPCRVLPAKWFPAYVEDTKPR